MIYVHVESFEEMKVVADYSGDHVKANSIHFGVYGTETIVCVDKGKGWWQLDYLTNEDLFDIPVLSFEEFSEQYLDGTATQDIVNHPNHYNSYTREVIDTMQGSMTPEEFKGYLKGNVMKYINRYQFKNGVEDLKKAQWYLNKLTEVVDKDELLDYSAF